MTPSVLVSAPGNMEGQTPQPVALITGAGGGIGSQLVLDFARAGYLVAASDIKGLDAPSNRNPQVEPFTADLAAPGTPERLIEAVTDRFGRLDVLINAAGWLRDARIEKLDLEELDAILDVNLVAPARLMRAAVAPMRRQEFGRIISLSSRAWLGNFGSTSYSTAKGGLVGATRQLALEVAACGITVNCIAPGYIETEMSRSLPDAIRQRVVSSIPVGRPGYPRDVSQAALFLAAAGSGYMTGQTMVICGGRSIGGSIAASAPERTEEGGRG